MSFTSLDIRISSFLVLDSRMPRPCAAGSPKGGARLFILVFLESQWYLCPPLDAFTLCNYFLPRILLITYSFGINWVIRPILKLQDYRGLTKSSWQKELPTMSITTTQYAKKPTPEEGPFTSFLTEYEALASGCFACNTSAHPSAEMGLRSYFGAWRCFKKGKLVFK